MKQLFALDFLSQTESLQLTMAGNFTYQYLLQIDPVEKIKNRFAKNRKISKIPVVVLFIDRFPQNNLNNSPPERGLATKDTNKIFAT